MTTTTPARRRLFSSPASAVKRRRVMTQTRIPKAMQPELKQFVTTANLQTSGTNTAYQSIPLVMNQGNDGDQFLGSKFRIARVRAYFDYTDVAVTSGVRMAFGIPKDPTTALILDNGTAGTVTPHNMREVTILKEMFLKTDGSNLNGYLEWTGPLNVEMSAAGSGVLKNNLIFQVNSDGVGSNLSTFTRTRIEILFTG